jgi:hypothetical protein
VSFPRKAIAALVGQLAGVECIWVEERNPQVGANGEQAWIELVILSDVPHGDGEYRQVENPNNPLALSSFIVLDKQVVVSLRAKSFDTEIQATELLADVRCQLNTVTAAAVYAEHNIAFVMTHPMSGIRAQGVGTRTRLEATMDVVWAARDGGAAKDDPGTTIGSASPPTLTGT